MIACDRCGHISEDRWSQYEHDQEEHNEIDRIATALERIASALEADVYAGIDWDEDGNPTERFETIGLATAFRRSGFGR